jgi:hypothetical protein
MRNMLYIIQLLVEMSAEIRPEVCVIVILHQLFNFFPLKEWINR